MRAFNPVGVTRRHLVRTLILPLALLLVTGCSQVPSRDELVQPLLQSLHDKQPNARNWWARTQVQPEVVALLGGRPPLPRSCFRLATGDIEALRGYPVGARDLISIQGLECLPSRSMAAKGVIAHLVDTRGRVYHPCEGVLNVASMSDSRVSEPTSRSMPFSVQVLPFRCSAIALFESDAVQGAAPGRLIPVIPGQTTVADLLADLGMSNALSTASTAAATTGRMICPARCGNELLFGGEVIGVTHPADQYLPSVLRSEGRVSAWP